MKSLSFFLLLCCVHAFSQTDVRFKIMAEMQKVEGEFAIAFYDFKTGEEILINEKEVFHAASTMKTPVMMELMHQVSLKKIKLNDKILIKNEFKSIMDGSPYKMDLQSDSDDQIYSWIATKKTYEELCFNMITVSSNLATNILIERLGAEKVMGYLSSLDIHNIMVKRGVEDTKAFKAGINNTTTAAGMLSLFKVMYTQKKLPGREKMIEILSQQKFNEMIPKYLPKGTEVAHKTGNITGVEHDTGIVFGPNGHDYALVILSKKLSNPTAGAEAIAKVSKILYDYSQK